MADTEHHEAHRHGTRAYWITAAILAVLTALEVGLFIAEKEAKVISLPIWAFAGALLLLSFGKGSLVVAMFMHLRGDDGVFKVVFLVPFLLASAMILSFLLLYGPGHVGIAG